MKIEIVIQIFLGNLLENNPLDSNPSPSQLLCGRMLHVFVQIACAFHCVALELFTTEGHVGQGEISKESSHI